MEEKEEIRKENSIEETKQIPQQEKETSNIKTNSNNSQSQISKQSN